MEITGAGKKVEYHVLLIEEVLAAEIQRADKGM